MPRTSQPDFFGLNGDDGYFDKVYAEDLFIGASGSVHFADPPGTTYYVDAYDGDNNNDGRAWATPFLTMAAAFAVLSSGDTIRFRGKVTEQLTTPVQVFDVTVIGDANRPRHADARRVWHPFRRAHVIVLRPALGH